MSEIDPMQLALLLSTKRGRCCIALCCALEGWDGQQAQRLLTTIEGVADALRVDVEKLIFAAVSLQKETTAPTIPCTP